MTDETEANVTATLEAIIGRLPDSDALLDQLVGARFEAGPTEVTITCRPDAHPTQVPDGPLPVRALVTDANGQTTGEILVWMENGYLSSAEHAWYTDDPPLAWPAATQLAFG